MNDTKNDPTQQANEYFCNNPLHALVDRLAEAFRIYFNAASGFASYGLAEYADAQKVLAEYDAAKKLPRNHE